jgi:hypothetical protein
MQAQADLHWIAAASIGAEVSISVGDEATFKRAPAAFGSGFFLCNDD